MILRSEACGREFLWGGELLKSKGSFGKVYLGKDLDSDKPVVIKHLHPQLLAEEDYVTRFYSESSVQFQHPNLTASIALIEQDEQLFLVREFAPGVDLSALARKRKFRRKLNEKFWLKVIIELLNGLHFLHKEGIIHRDIRPTNLIIDTSRADFLENPKVKIIDFGLIKNLHKQKKERKVPFALIYSPPEQLLNFNELTNRQSDLYATGISFYELIGGKVPFKHSHPEMLMNLQVNMPLPASGKISRETFKLLCKASEKTKFPLPPNRYSRRELSELLQQGQALRYADARAMKEAAEIVLQGLS